MDGIISHHLLKMWFPLRLECVHLLNPGDDPLEKNLAFFCLAMLGKVGAGERVGSHLAISAQRGKLEF